MAHMKYQISSRQVLYTFFIIVSLSAGLPSSLINALGQDFWQGIIIALAMDLLLGWFLFKLGLQFKEKTIFEYSEMILGKIVGKFYIALFSLFFFLVAFDLIVGQMSFFSSVVMPETPNFIFALGVLLVSTYAVSAGIETIVRLTEFFAPFILGAYLFIVIFNFDEMNIHHLLPMFQHSLAEVLQGAILPTYWFGVCIIMGVIMAYHNNPQKIFKIKIKGVGLGVLFFMIMVFSAIMSLGVQVSAEQKFSIFVMASMVRIGDFFERLEAFMVASWTVGVFYIVSLFQYAGVEGLRIFFPKKSRTFLAVGTGIAIFLATFLLPTSHQLMAYRQGFYPYFCLAVELGGVTSLYLVFVLKQKFKEAGKKTSDE